MLLKSKWQPPSLNTKHVPRPELVARIGAPAHALTLIQAPAGYGKTELAREWADQADHSVAWLRLDHKDNDLQRFWQYLIGALRTFEPEVGVLAQKQLSLPDTAEAENAVALLLNDILHYSNEARPWTLILEDTHRLDDPLLLDSLNYFLDYLPPSLNLIITSRTEPPLQLSRRLGYSRLTHLTSRDLAFDFNQSKHYLQQHGPLPLQESYLEQLIVKADGWITALQLAAMHLSHEPNPEEFIAHFSGMEKHVHQYLLQEVLKDLSEDTLAFLRATAWLPLLHPRLCDWVCQASDLEIGDSQERLASLLADNLFVMAIDHQQQWFRYHDLFRELLLQHLCQHQRPDDRDLIEQVAHWYRGHDQAEMAVELLVAIQAWPSLVQVIEEEAPAHRKRFEYATVHQWLQYLPDTQLYQRPKLMSLLIWSRSFLPGESVEPAVVRAALQARQTLSQASADSLQTVGVHSELERLTLWVDLSFTQATMARFQSRFDDSLALTREAYATAQQHAIEPLWRAQIELAQDRLIHGEVQEAFERAQNGLDGLLQHSSEMAFGVMIGLICSGLAAMEAGRLEALAALQTRVRHWLQQHQLEHLPLANLAYLIEAELAWERHKLPEAQRAIKLALSYIEQGAPLILQNLGHHLRYRVAFSGGDWEEAEDAVQAITRLHQLYPDLLNFGYPSVAALKAELGLARGDALAGARWLETQWVSIKKGERYWHEKEQLIALKVLWARGDTHKVAQLAKSIRQRASQGQRWRHVWVSSCYEALSRSPLRLNPALLDSLSQAQASGLAGSLLDHHEVIQPLLNGLSEHPGLQSFLRGLQDMADQSLSAREAEQQPVELSKRERQVLALLSEGLSNRAISESLGIAPATVKTHLRNIFEKLDVASRVQALVKAKSLGLLR